MKHSGRPPFREATTKVLETFGPGIQFTQAEAWEKVPTKMQDALAAFYTDDAEKGTAMEQAKSRFFANLTVASNQNHSGGVPGLTLVESRKGGSTRFVWSPPGATEKRANRPAVGTRVTFTVAGYSADGDVLYRDDDGALGWFGWDAL